MGTMSVKRKKGKKRKKRERKRNEKETVVFTSVKAIYQECGLYLLCEEKLQLREKTYCRIGN